MTQLKIKHWQDPVNAVLGLWILASPWIVGYRDESAALLNAVIAGLVLFAVAVGALFVPRAWEEWAQGAIGLWLIASPWALGFPGREAAMLSAMWTGVAVVALAAWTLLSDREHGAGRTQSAAH